MTLSAKEKFISWYLDHQNDQFDFQKEMLEYCRSDVDILRRCCLIFREEFLKIADVDPFQYVTIASACMAAYRNSHIKDDTIAMVPAHGYRCGKNYSPDAIRWLDYISSCEGIEIQHSLNKNGERKIGGVFVDGYCEETKTVYQYQGCFFHGCGVCYDGDSRHPLKGITMSSVRQKTAEICAKIQALGYTVVEMWEHEFLRRKKEDPNLQSFLTTHTLQDRLNPRDSFFGGRTNAIKLHHEGNIKYVDFTSLYPWVNKYCLYPVGHPQIITENFGEIEDYFGIIRCRVIPPFGLFLPVLPYRCQNKLMFPLCRTCVEIKQQEKCTHTENERAFIGTWVSEELKLAKKKGYRITDMYEVYHFPRSSNSLFRTYIDTFLKIKQESSGWPSNCTTEERKIAYVQEYKQKEGIKLDPQNIEKNPGRRQVAKLALNSFWGRWGMNTARMQLNYVHTLSEFNKLLADPSKNIKDVYLPTPEVAAIQWEFRKEFVSQDASTNVFLASFTTAWARIKLYDEMEKLGKSVLYHDTDSIIYASDGTNDPPLGNFLGEFTDELDGDTITTFVSGGPKNYAFKTKSGETCCKVRGFTLNSKNVKKLNFEAMEALIQNMDLETTIPLETPNKITRDAKRRKVINKKEIKTYRMVYDKRIIQKDYSTLPYGY
ncbi:uncharacterized protein LOC129966256 [Argiope bruennichi]|uniref:uncharacterized protein LOC129966256 n=1 Tax=Argiope bruennichi TaxID=94029 RepID=UPI0024951175|nr:uncharacterized protein LOC129966256 [Argiope bruennichi]